MAETETATELMKWCNCIVFYWADNNKVVIFVKNSINTKLNWGITQGEWCIVSDNNTFCFFKLLTMHKH